MRNTYSAHELARAAGYTIRPVADGGLVVHEAIKLLEVGPRATELDLVRVASRHLEIDLAKVCPSTESNTHAASA